MEAKQYRRITSSPNQYIQTYTFTLLLRNTNLHASGQLPYMQRERRANIQGTINLLNRACLTKKKKKRKKKEKKVDASDPNGSAIQNCRESHLRHLVLSLCQFIQVGKPQRTLSITQDDHQIILLITVTPLDSD
jgi:hypothetical protein